jgi:hypothetical protein
MLPSAPQLPPDASWRGRKRPIRSFVIILFRILGCEVNKAALVTFDWLSFTRQLVRLLHPPTPQNEPCCTPKLYGSPQKPLSHPKTSRNQNRVSINPAIPCLYNYCSCRNSIILISDVHRKAYLNPKPWPVSLTDGLITRLSGR